MKKIFFRVSCSKSSGIGHLMRSIWLSKSLNALYKLEIVFFINKNSFSQKLLKKYKISHKFTNSEYPVTVSDAKFISNFNPNLIICDTPKTKDIWFEHLKENKFKTLLICSENNYSSISDYRLWPETYRAALNKKKNRFGLNYSLLSPSYWKKNYRKNNIKKIKNILITFGGCDHLNLSEMFINTLNFYNKKLIIKIVIGKFYKNIKTIKSAAKNSIHKVKLIYQPYGLYNYLIKSDLVINGGGTTALETNSLRINSITMAIWKSQEKLTTTISKNKNYILCTNKSKFKLKKEIQKLLERNLYEKAKSIKTFRAVDGKGCIRTAKWIKSLIH